jgi:formate dehydrogenase gamma subunit
MKERIIEDKKVIIRHGPIELMEHWVLAISGLLLIFSGLGELPMYKRFMVTQIPGLSWAGDYLINLKIHYLAGIAFVSIIVFHALYHGWLGHRGLFPKKGDLKASGQTILSMLGFGEEPKMDKYLPEQRLAYAYLGGVGLILGLTGLVKVFKNDPRVYFSPATITTVTLIHTFATIFFILGILAHLAALLFKVNRPLAKAIFTGKVDVDYAKKRHVLWYEELTKKKAETEIEKEEETKEKLAGEDLIIQPQAKGQKNEVVDNGGKPADSPKEEDINILKVRGMSCPHCALAVTKALEQLEGIQNIQVDLPTGEVRFYNAGEVPTDKIEEAIAEAGYEVIRAQPMVGKEIKSEELR